MTTIADCSYDEQGEAEANHIVKCVNAHDELVDALKGMLEAFDPLDPSRKQARVWDRASAILAKIGGAE